MTRHAGFIAMQIERKGRRNRFGSLKQNGQIRRCGRHREINNVFITIQWIDGYRGETDTDTLARLEDITGGSVAMP